MGRLSGVNQAGACGLGRSTFGRSNWNGERHFPPDYAQRHAFYLFDISTASVKGSIYSQSANLNLLLSFLDGFHLVEIAP